MSIKVGRTSTSTKDVSQSRLGNEQDRFLIKFGPEESTQDKTKEVVYQGEFTNFKLLFQNNN